MCTQPGKRPVEQLISGVNCVARTAVPEFEAVKKQFRKTEGRGYYHIVQAFAPDDRWTLQRRTSWA